MKKIIAFFILSFYCYTGQAQVLISLVFGDKLNSDKIEFGLDGGLDVSTINGKNGAHSMNGFNLGFYFDFKLKNPAWMINTGVIVKSPMGAKGMPVYSLNDPILDTAFKGGSVRTNLGYFNVPIMMKYQFKNHIYVKAGAQLGLMNKAYDEFTKNVESGDDLELKKKTKEQYHPIDAGLAVGAGYRLMGGNGMNIGIQYYLGLLDILVDDSGPNQTNRAFYLNVGIPIGKGAAAKKRKEKESKNSIQ
ncbi:porin family protein [Flavihumibacter profundi]|uniref:porin family protein n=1 Tax=Flavihumibacter profundi TaxID=2716883 RepID=UPI001CC5C143|nr:porin family protein [Flavihumibacter profundi]MBZ5858582.1 PorT family protein [Flavihumibacter profundi]